MEIEFLKLLEGVDKAMKDKLKNEIVFTGKLGHERQLILEAMVKVQEAITILLRAN